MISIVKSMTLQGLKGVVINVEVDVSKGMPAWNVVGLPDASIKESKERIKTAIKNVGIDLYSRKYTINLAPADFRKEGTGLDLPIAIAILQSVGYIKKSIKDNVLIIGELSLDGKINRINGILAMCMEALKYEIKKVIVPLENVKEASLVEGIEVIGVNNLIQVIDYLNGKISIIPTKNDIKKVFNSSESLNMDFSEVKGHESIKRALEIAAAGRT